MRYNASTGERVAEEWITVEEARSLTDYSLKQIYRLLRSGTVKGQKYVTVWRVERASLLAYFRKQKERGQKPGPKRKRKKD